MRKEIIIHNYYNPYLYGHPMTIMQLDFNGTLLKYSQTTIVENIFKYIEIRRLLLQKAFPTQCEASELYKDLPFHTRENKSWPICHTLGNNSFIL